MAEAAAPGAGAEESPRILDFSIEAGGALCGELRVPGDKSISHRALMLGALADGETRITGFLRGEDTLATARAMQAMGVDISGLDESEVIVRGVGLDGLRAPPEPLFLGNSGTSMRLFCGLLAGQPFDSELRGDASLSRRPMRRVTEPLALMGAEIVSSAEGTPPLRICGGRSLTGIDYAMPVASAQVKSAILLAALRARGETRVREAAATRDHTERLLTAFGYPVACGQGTVCVAGGGRLTACDVPVPADISSAAFFMVGAAIAPGSDLLLREVGINPTRAGAVDILRRFGADIRILDERVCGGEPVADIRVRAAPLRGIQIPENLVPAAIDELPVILVAAACAEGETILSGAAELKVKESDRIAAVASGLQALGIAAQPRADGMVVQGGRFRGGRVASRGDHRIAMAFAIAALRAEAPITVEDCENVRTSFPGFVAQARGVGVKIHEVLR